MSKKPNYSHDRNVQVELSVDMIEQVYLEYERDNPGRTHLAITKTEFTDRLMKKMKASAKFVTQ